MRRICRSLSLIRTLRSNLELVVLTEPSLPQNIITFHSVSAILLFIYCYTISLAIALCYRQSSHDSSSSSPSHEPRPPRNGSTPTRTSQRMTSCALPKTEPVGDDLQSTVHWSTDDDDNVPILLAELSCARSARSGAP